jgi:hypothetical protein
MIAVVGAIDRRVTCIVSQAPMISGLANFRRLVRADVIGPLRQMFADDRAARYRGETPAMVPVVSNDPMQPCALPTPDSWTWFTETGASRAPGWRNEVTLRSVEMLSEYEPGAYIAQISPTPLLMVVAVQDHLTVADLALQAYEAALVVEPRFAGPANNLALLLSTQGDDAGALNFALRAQALAPQDPHILDTVGWILFKRGEYQRALNTLTESARLLPE